MSIKVKVGTAAEDARPDIKLTIKEKNTKEYNLHLRKALNGDLMIFDHTDIDIIVMLQEKKVVAFAKDIMSEIVYGAEDRLFSHLRQNLSGRGHLLLCYFLVCQYQFELLNILFL